MLNFLGLKIFYYTIVGLITLGIVFTVKSMFIPLLIAFFIAIILRPIVTFFESKGFSHTNIIITLFVSFFAISIIGIVLLIPILGEQLNSFNTKIPEILNMLQQKAVALQNSIDNKIPFIDISHLTENIKILLGKSIDGFGGKFGSYLSDIMNIFTFSILVPFFSFFMLKDMHLMKKTLFLYIPNKYFEIAALLLYKIGNSVQLYIRGQIIDSAFVGIMTGLGLSIIGFPYALVVGLIAGIGNFVPYFGPVIGAIPAVLIILITPQWANESNIVLVIVVFAIVQTVETILVYPIAIGNSINLHPIIVILALLVGGELAGILGMIVMIPAAAILKLTFEILNYYIKEYHMIES